ncbi:MAG TPA: acyl-CoA dehydrogenase family protein [Myxococcota bacterium]|nr:acyl-CoA dehydrogenase family protein [Myxococcota bacterium]
MDADSVRREARAWLEANWSPEQSLLEWRNKLADSGWGCPTWPQEWYGRGLPVALGDAVQEEFDRIGAVGTPGGGGMTLAAPTILEHGSDDLKRRLLRNIVTGEDTWCQLFSEPGSGSDLAGLTTRAELSPDGDEFVVNGQKLWTTSAHHAKYGMLLARTNWDVPKHRGITYFAIEMHQPGVVVKPLKQMNGHASFNEVFLNDARVPAANTIGDVGNGWTVALATLAHERRSFDVMQRAARTSRGKGRAYEEQRAETAQIMAPYTWYPQRAGRADLIVERAQATGKNRDPVVRQEIAKLLSLARATEWTAKRARAARMAGRPPGPEGSLGKLYASEIARACNRVHTLIHGTDAMLSGADSPVEGVIAEILVSTPAVSIAGGTDEIQRNIVSERVLGLPKEPDLVSQKPFRDVPRNAR